MIEKLFEITRHFQRAIYMGEIDGSTNVLDHFMDRPEVVPRFNKIILDEEAKFISFQSPAGEGEFMLRWLGTQPYIDTLFHWLSWPDVVKSSINYKWKWPLLKLQNDTTNKCNIREYIQLLR